MGINLVCVVKFTRGSAANLGNTVFKVNQNHVFPELIFTLPRLLSCTQKPRLAVSIKPRLRAGRPGFDSRKIQRQGFFRFVTASRPTVGLPFVSVGHQGSLSPRDSWPGREADYLTLRICGVILPLPSTSSWLGTWLRAETTVPLLVALLCCVVKKGMSAV